MFVFCFCYALLCVLSSFAIILSMKRFCCFSLIVFLVSCDCKCFVASPHGVVASPHGVPGWSVVCNVVFADHTHLLLKYVYRFQPHP